MTRRGVWLLIGCLLGTNAFLEGCSSSSSSPNTEPSGQGGASGAGGGAPAGAGGGTGVGGRGGNAGGMTDAPGMGGAVVTGQGGSMPTPDAAAPDTTTPPRDATSPDTPIDNAVADAANAGEPTAGQYGMRAVLPERNSEMAIAALDGKVYVLGGYPSSPAETRPTLQIYDTATNTWKLGMPSPVPLHHPVIAGVNGKLYSLGGQPDTDRTLEYDPATDRWTGDRQPMPTARGGGAGAVIDDKIYVVGARPPAGGASNPFEVYDVGDNAWTKLAPLPPPAMRNHLAAVSIGGKIYVAGGRYDGCCVDAPRTDVLHVFDPTTGAWTAKKPMLRPRGGVAGVAAFGCFHVFGGEGANIGEPNNVFPDHDVYNPVTDTWTALPRLPIPFHGVTGGAFANGLIYMPGGGIASGGASGRTQHQVFRPSMVCQ